MIIFNEKGDFSKTNTFFQRLLDGIDMSILDKYGREGVARLQAATPVQSGVTANSWYYTTTREKGLAKLTFHNSNVKDGYPIAILIQYGHATGTGGWVEGLDYINPALQPIFEELANEVWKGVAKS